MSRMVRSYLVRNRLQIHAWGGLHEQLSAARAAVVFLLAKVLALKETRNEVPKNMVIS